MSKRLLLLWLGCFVYSAGWTQIVLNVPLRGQMATKWCWAASIEMMARYYDNATITQCDIVNTDRRLRGEVYLCPFTADCLCSSVPDSCNKPMSSSVRFMNVLDSYSLTASSSSNPLSWSAIKTEIDNCQPLALHVSRYDFSDGQDSSGDHYIIAKGYIEQNCTDQFLVINDPWTPCEGCQYALNYASLIDSSSANLGIRSVNYWFYDIKPRDQLTGCLPSPLHQQVSRESIPCPPPAPMNHLPSTPRQALDQTLKTLKSCFPVLSRQFLDISSNSRVATLQKRYPLRVILEGSMRDSIRYQKPFDTRRRYLFYGPDSSGKYPLEAIMQQRLSPQQSLVGCPNWSGTGEYWLVESIGPCSFLCSRMLACALQSWVRIGVSAKNVWVGGIQLPFGLVVYPAYHYSFRRFIYRQRTYYYSLINYPDLTMADGNPFQANIAYSGHEVLRQLHLRTRKSS